MSGDAETTTEPSNATSPRDPPGLRTLERAVLLSRWLQLPMLLGLMVALVVLEFVFALHLIDLIGDEEPLSRIKVILVTLDLIDMILIGNLIVMVLSSGYTTFISPLRLADDPALPAWLRTGSPGQLKLKIAATVLLISTIHLLHMFLDPATSEEQDANFMLIAQAVFALTTLVFVAVERFEGRDR